MLSEISPIQKNKYCMIHLYEEAKILKLIVTKSRMAVTESCGEGEMGVVVQKIQFCTSLVAQWLRIRLPMEGIRVQALVREDPTCHGAAKSMRHNY